MVGSGARALRVGGGALGNRPLAALLPHASQRIACPYGPQVALPSPVGLGHALVVGDLGGTPGDPGNLEMVNAEHASWGAQKTREGLMGGFETA